MQRAIAIVALSLGCAARPGPEARPSLDEGRYREIEIRQDEGVVGWVVPGPRALGAIEFGTPANPLRTAEPSPELPELQRDLLGMVPYLVGVPLSDRGVDGERYTTTLAPTPFGDLAIPVDGQLMLRARDRRRGDRDREPLRTRDEAELVARFTDPDGTSYALRLTRVIEPPVPGWETDGGVLLGDWIGGGSGVDSPLAPFTWAFAAVWGVVDVLVGGEVVDRDVLARIAVTEPTRDRDNRLVQSWELPLALDGTTSGRPHHTSLVLWPVRVTDDGAWHEPLSIPFLGADARPQPFVHLVFEGAEIVRGPALTEAR